MGHQGVAGGQSGSSPLPQPGPLLLLLLLLLLLPWWSPYSYRRFSEEVSLAGLVPLLSPGPDLVHWLSLVVLLQGGAGGQCGSPPLPLPEPLLLLLLMLLLL